jgi:hypothetical protein
MIVRDQTFEDAKISLDGGSFYSCTLRRCTLVYSGLLPVIFEGGIMDACKWEFNGPAMNTIQFLSAMYKGGSAELVESTFRAIRGQAAPVTPTVAN